MIDPGAIGTLLIGLDAGQSDHDHRRRRRTAPAPRREQGGIRPALARSLRRAASLLERPTVGEVAG